MAEVITQCDCGQLPALEPGEIPPAFIDYADDNGTRWNEPRAAYEERRRAEYEACGAEAGEECRPMCIGQAAELDRQQEARESASADYLAEWKAAQSLPTLPEAQAAAWAAEQKRVSAWQAIARGAAPQ